MLDRWFVEGADELPKPRAELEAETDANLATWNRHGPALCGAFLDEAAQGTDAVGADVDRRQRGVARPLVPRADVVPRRVARRGEHLHRERRAAARVAVRDHLGAGGRPDEPLHRLGVGRLEQRRDVDVAGTRDPPRSRVARCHRLARELVGAPDVEQDEPRLVEASCELAGRDVGHASEATVSSSAATDGRSPHVSSQRSIASCPASE